MARIPAIVLILLHSSWLFAGVSGRDLASAAKAQIGVTRYYDGRYRTLAYPGGDPPMDRGVCSDVVIRAYRPFGIDLQVLVHEDMSRAWNEYPNLWHMRSTDRNIDHRRVPNLATFFRRHGQCLSINKDREAFLPGDIVTWQLVSGVPHVGIVSSEPSKAGTPLVIHNIGSGTRLEDCLFDFRITGHYRYPRD